MQLSYRIRRLILISIGIIILSLASEKGFEGSENESVSTIAPQSRVKRSIDPEALVFAAEAQESARKSVRATQSTIEKSAQPKSASAISAEAYLVANLETGEVYSSKNIGTVFPIASLTKLVTALTAMKHMPSDQKIVITQSMLGGYGTAGELRPGDVLSVSELLMPLLLPSSNDAAEAFAQTYGYEEFVGTMNALVRELSMTSTSFADPSGMSSENVSNARDLLTLSRHLYAQKRSFLDLTRRPSVTLASTTDHTAYTWNSNNPFPLDPHFIGGKTGRTNEAKESMISLFRYEKGGAAYPVAVIVLRSEFSSREIDTSELLSRFIARIEER